LELAIDMASCSSAIESTVCQHEPTVGTDGCEREVVANELRESVASLDGTEENAVAAANIATATTTDTTSALASDLPPAEVVGSDGEDDAGKATEANSKVEVDVEEDVPECRYCFGNADDGELISK
jgi:hypothetical protein